MIKYLKLIFKRILIACLILNKKNIFKKIEHLMSNSITKNCNLKNKTQTKIKANNKYLNCHGH